MLSLPTPPQSHRLPNGNTLYLMPSNAIDILKFDFTFEAGPAYQSKPLLAQFVSHLLPRASQHLSASQVAEFIDYRGIVIEPALDTFTSCITVYTLKKYATELLPLLCQLIQEPSFPEVEFQTHLRKRRHQLQTSFKKTSYVARNIFYQALYGSNHPLGTFARPEDVDGLTLDDLRQFHADRYHLGQAHLQLAGNFDDRLLAQYESLFAPASSQHPIDSHKPSPEDNSRSGYAMPRRENDSCEAAIPNSQFYPIPNSVQTTIRIGRILPLEWSDPEYAQFTILNTLLGGYFGSRLMSNIREDKGYTYGIYSQTVIHRGSIIFFISADVGCDVVQPAIDEIYHEIDRLRTQPVSDDELDLVRHYMKGDYLRSIDGLFECSERIRQMAATRVTEQFSQNLIQAISAVTPAQLQQLAQRFLDPADLTQVVVGNL